ncbi:RNase HII [Thalassoporum mexicanum PCC 7367]|uniref:ribonuclease HII n=1 Tax=Thalassoporum mexicanum TaxID=3457544 RepID=UPI00029FE336|nr:ribonuclease HII [Pseudanabaena sp. PCC 7367]AFY69463.1 RNase HII [Pseudanabaena sp. PCC 7367]
MNKPNFEPFWQFECDRHPVAGVDEVGRGALFGAVVAAAVILPVEPVDRLALAEHNHTGCYGQLVSAGVRDSKQLSATQRDELDSLIRSVAIDCQIGTASVAEIAELNILNASLLAMERAIAQLQPRPNHCLIDGNRQIKFKIIAPIDQTTVVKGDQKSLSIAAASIIAKVWRDRYVIDLAEKYPDYDLVNNKGYATAKHRQAIKELGFSDLHRRSFKLQELAGNENLSSQLPDQQLDLLNN